MTGLSVIKRPMVFTWAEIQKYPTLEARFAETLPFGFDSDRAKSCKCGLAWYPPELSVEVTKLKKKCIKRTGERWAWFSAARDIDHERGERLGTLGYLPWEIRQMILAALVREDLWHIDYFDDLSPTAHIHDAEGYPPLTRVDFCFCWCGIRFASPSLEIEFEHCYFTNKSFYLGEPSHLRALLDALSIYQQSLLRNLVLDIFRTKFDRRLLDDWLACCPLLPPNLASINFDRGTLPWETMKNGEEWFICCGDPRMSNKWAETLDLLGSSARRCAPKAKIGLAVEPWEAETGDPSNEKWVRVLDDVEPWSTTWLEWWEEDKKVAMDSGEGDNDTA